MCELKKELLNSFSWIFLKHHKAHSTYLRELNIPTVIQQIFIENPLSVPGSLLGAGGVTVNMTHSLTSFLSMLNAFMGNGTSKRVFMWTIIFKSWKWHPLSSLSSHQCKMMALTWTPPQAFPGSKFLWPLSLHQVGVKGNATRLTFFHTLNTNTKVEHINQLSS